MSLKLNLFHALALLLTLVALTGCQSTKNFMPPDGYTLSSRETSEVNLYFKFNLNQDFTHQRANQMREIVEHYFRKSKRFSIWWRKDTSIEEDVMINAYFETMPVKGGSVSGMGAKVTLTAFCNHVSGLAGESISVMGFSKPEYAKNTFLKPMEFSVEKHFTDALNNALQQLQQRIEGLYPISSKVKAFRCDKAGKAELSIPIGTNFGLSSRYEYLVCYKNNGNFTVIGIAEGAPGAESSQMTIATWNKKAFGFDSVYQRIKNNDQTLLRDLFVIARLKQ